MNQNVSNDRSEARWVDDIVEVLESLGGIASLEQINEEIMPRRTSLSETWRATVRRTIQEHCSDTVTYRNRGGEREDLFFSLDGLGSGIWGLRSHLDAIPDSTDVDPAPVLPAGDEAPGRAIQKTYRVLRDTLLAKKMKLLYRDRCQICDIALKLTAGSTYSEAHHIIPLGNHNGPDVPGNILVLCPNHHVLCDYGAIRLDLPDLNVRPGHDLLPRSLRYHNERIFGRIA